MDKQRSPVPGADYVTTKKSSRRKKKTASKDETSEAGPSSGATLHPPLQALPSSTTAQAAQAPASTDSRQSRQASSQPGQEMLSTLSISTPTQTSSAGKSKSAVGTFAERSAVQTTPTSGVPNRGLAGSNDSKPIYSTGGQRGKSLPVTEDFFEEPSIKDPTHTDSQAGPSKAPHQQHQARPGGAMGVGSQGKIVSLATNYFRLNVEPGWKLHHYSIKVWPEAKGRKLAQMIKDALLLPDFAEVGPGIVSDFAAVLISQQELPDELLKVSVPYKKNTSTEESNDTSLSNDAKDTKDAEAPDRYYVKFDLVRIVDLTNEADLQETSPDQETLPIVQDLDIVLGHHRKFSSNISMIGKRRAFQKTIPVGGSSFLSADHTQETALLLAVRGYFSSVRLSTTGILVNVNVTHGAFYIPRALQDWLSMVRGHAQVHTTKIPGLLKGLQVGLRHLRQKRVIKTISGYASPGQGNGFEAHPPRVSKLGAGPRDVMFFEYKSTKPILDQIDKDKAKKGHLTAHNIHLCGCDGSYISVFDYFSRKYPGFQDPEDQPVVNVGNAQHPSYLPLSACWVIFQPAKLNLSSDETDLMQKFAARVPYDNAESIRQYGFTTLGLTRDTQKLRTLGIDIDPKRLALSGRTLPQPTVMFNKMARYTGSQWNLSNLQFRSASKLRKWGCLNIHRGQSPQTCHNDCLRNFVDVLASCGIDAAMPDTTHLRQNRLNAELETVFKQSTGIDLLLVVLPEKNSQLYNWVKLLGDVRYGIQTICVLGSRDKFYNVKPKSTPYNSSVALKVNIKNGGINHVLRDNQLGFINEGDTMVIGIDVTHPSPGSGANALSVAAMVASSDKYLAQWPAEIRINPARQEKVESLHSMLRAHLMYWKEKHGSFPEKLLIYRDGVSDGQYQMVLDEELPNLRRACHSVYEKQQLPHITLIVVGKRHHTRFYCTKRATGEVLKEMQGNPSFGTVVDSVIVDQARNWDFYLQSHTALHGTARPAHYFVLVDEIFKDHTKKMLPKGCENPSDLLYMITYNMCYLSCRSITSVSIPPPVYYADVACDRARRWNSRVFDASQSEVNDELEDHDVTVNKSLSKTMFYI